MRARSRLLLLVLLACSRGDRPRAADGARHRIVCLTPSSTEVVAALGATDQIVGVDQYSVYPVEVQHLPKVGDYVTPNLETILALHPDIAVLDAVQSQIQGKIQAAGITTVSLQMQTIADIRTGLRQVGVTLGRSAQANAQIAQLDRDLARLREQAAHERAAAGHGVRVRVLVIVDRQPGGLGGLYAAGPNTFLDEVITLLSGQNVLAGSPVRYASLSVENVIALAPDVILETTPATDPARARADWNVLASVPAVAHGRVHLVADPVLQAPGPRLATGIARLLPLLWP